MYEIQGVHWKLLYWAGAQSPPSSLAPIAAELRNKLFSVYISHPVSFTSFCLLENHAAPLQTRVFGVAVDGDEAALSPAIWSLHT